MIPNSRFLAMFLSVLVVAGAGMLTLWLARINQFFFGRHVTDEFRSSAPARQIESYYRKQMLAGVLLACALVVVFEQRQMHLPQIAVLFLAWIALAVWFQVTFARCHRKAGELLQHTPGAAAKAPAIAVSLQQAEPTGGPWSAMLLPVACAALGFGGAAFRAQLGWSQFAAQIGDRGGSYLLGMGCGMLFAAVGCQAMLRFGSRMRNPMARLTLRVTRWLAWASAVLIAAVAASVPMHFVIPHAMVPTITWVLLAFALAMAVQRMRHARSYAPPAAEQMGDSCWRWGLYYFNPEDPALLVQGRVGTCYTLNFANRAAWPIAAFIAADFTFLIVRQILR